MTGEILEICWSKRQLKIISEKVKDNNLSTEAYIKFIVCRKLNIHNQEKDGIGL